MDEPFDLTEILSFLWKKKTIIIAVTLIFMLVPFIKLGIIDKKQQPIQAEVIENVEEVAYFYAQTTFTVVDSGETVNKELENFKNDLSDFRVSTYSEIIKSQAFLNNVIGALNLNIDYNDLYNLISVSRVSNSNVVRIVVANTDKDQALNIANALLNEFTNNINNVYVKAQISIIDKAYILSDQAIADIFKSYIMQYAGSETNLSNTLFNVDITRILPSQYLSKIFNEYVLTDKDILSSASFAIIGTLVPPPATASAIPPSNPNVLRKVCIAGAIGFILSAGCLIVVDFLSNTINSEKYINTKILATINKLDSKDIFDVLKIKLEQNKTFIVTSTETTEKTQTAINSLATAFAKDNKKVLLLDLTSNSSNLLKEYSGKGIFDCTNDFSSINKYATKSTIDNLDILLQGSVSNSCINENDLRSIVSSLENTYDYVIINSKNISEDANSLLLTKIVKNAVLLITQRKTKIDSYNKSKESIADVNANLIGSILIK